MPLITNAEKREAAAYLSSSFKRQRVTEPSIATEVARRRIHRGQYGQVTPENDRVREAADDLGLSSRQQKALREKLREPMPVCTLDRFFERVDTPQHQQAVEPAEPSLSSAVERMGVSHQRLLVGKEWLRANTPVLLQDYELHEGLDISSPFEDSDEEYSGELVRMFSVYTTSDGRIATDADWDTGCPLHTGGCMILGTVHYSPPPSHGESDATAPENIRREQAALQEFALDVTRGAGWAPVPIHQLEQEQEQDRQEREQREREQCEREEQEHTEVSGGRAVLLDFYCGGSPQAHQAAQIMRDAGVSCRTLFASCQQTDSCGYNGSKWACMLWALGPERFYSFTHEQASVVLQPSFIAEQNVKLGYGHSTAARWLGSRRIMELATLDNPDGTGVDPWWLTCPAYDHFLEAFQNTISDADHYRRGGLEIMVVNTDCAGASGKHWFVVAWVIE